MDNPQTHQKTYLHTYVLCHRGTNIQIHINIHTLCRCYCYTHINTRTHVHTHARTHICRLGCWTPRLHSDLSTTGTDIGERVGQRDSCLEEPDRIHPCLFCQDKVAEMWEEPGVGAGSLSGRESFPLSELLAGSPGTVTGKAHSV